MSGASNSYIYRRLFYVVTLSLGMVWIFIGMDASGASMSSGISAPQVGFLAPGFESKTTEGNTIALSSLRGQAVLVNIWTTWCPPCRAEMPAIEKMYREYKDRGFIALAVNSTFQDKIANISPFVEEYNLTFPILLDESGGITSAYEVRSLPSSFFIGRDGIIREVVIGGPMSEALLRIRIENILE